MQELRAFVGDAAIITSAKYSLEAYLLDGCCLCPVDLRETAKAAGYKSYRHKHDSMRSVWKPVAPLSATAPPAD